RYFSLIVLEPCLKPDILKRIATLIIQFFHIDIHFFKTSRFEVAKLVNIITTFVNMVAKINDKVLIAEIGSTTDTKVFINCKLIEVFSKNIAILTSCKRSRLVSGCQKQVRNIVIKKTTSNLTIALHRHADRN